MPLGEDILIGSAEEAANRFADLVEGYIRDKQMNQTISENDLSPDGANKLRDAYALDNIFGIGVYRYRQLHNWIAEKIGGSALLPAEEILRKSKLREGPTSTEEVFVHEYDRRTGHVNAHTRSRPGD